jgi:hypothetical protein
LLFCCFNARSQSEYGQKLVGQVVELIKSQKRPKNDNPKAGYVAILDGYKFYYDKMKDSVNLGMRYYWQCGNCHARLIIGEDNVVTSVGDHSCEKAPKEVC